jgi:hypothetical protein
MLEKKMFLIFASLVCLTSLNAADDEPETAESTSQDNYDPVYGHFPENLGIVRGLIPTHDPGECGLYIPPDRDK